MIATAELRRMQPHAILINCSRGEVVDVEALHQALEASRLPAPDWTCCRRNRHRRRNRSCR